jgi:tetratricopeptide (TPR) repeat protein
MTHLGKDEIGKVLSQAAGPAEVSAALAHLFSCLGCLVEAEGILGSPGVEASGKAAGLLQRYLDLQQENVVELLLADDQWSEIKDLGPKVQKDRIATTAICKTGAFARLLLEELKSAGSWDRAERLATLVAASVNAMDAREYPASFKNDLRGEVAIELANSRRRAAEWNRAAEALQRADSFLAQGSGSPSLRARRLAISGQLEADRGRLDRALADLEEAIAIYHGLGQPGLVARTLLLAANALTEPDPERGLILLNEADPKFPPGDPLALNARLCRIDCLIWTGQLREAVSHFTVCERPNKGRMQIRYKFLGARLLHALGNRKEAERMFQHVVTDDLERDLFKDALLDLLYLLKVHLFEGEVAKALAVCQRALGEPVLAEFAHEQLKGVWQQVLVAVERRVLDPEALSSLKHYMSLHWRHPASQPPSFVRSK